MLTLRQIKELSEPELNTFYKSTKFDSTAQKKKFESHFKRFLLKGCPESLFYKWFYSCLSNCFGHYAHYSKNNFYADFFTTGDGKIDFIKWCLDYPCYGDPEYTYSDVEKVLQNWIRKNIETIWKQNDIPIS